MRARHLFFVHGILKRGGVNHVALHRQRFVTVAFTEPHHALYDLGGYPGLVHTADRPQAIRDGLWEVDDLALERLDTLEDRDVLFGREEVVVRDKAGRSRRA